MSHASGLRHSDSKRQACQALQAECSSLGALDGRCCHLEAVRDDQMLGSSSMQRMHHTAYPLLEGLSQSHYVAFLLLRNLGRASLRKLHLRYCMG